MDKCDHIWYRRRKRLHALAIGLLRELLSRNNEGWLYGQSYQPMRECCFDDWWFSFQDTSYSDNASVCQLCCLAAILDWHWCHFNRDFIDHIDCVSSLRVWHDRHCHKYCTRPRSVHNKLCDANKDAGCCNVSSCEGGYVHPRSLSLLWWTTNRNWSIQVVYSHNWSLLHSNIDHRGLVLCNITYLRAW